MKILQMKLSDLSMEVKLLMLILFLYSFSFAFPKTIGMVEFMIGVLLAVWLFKPMLYLLRFEKPLFSSIFLSLFVLQMIVGIINHNDFSSMLRDIIPYFYITIPLIFFSKPIDQRILKQLHGYVPLLLIFVGVVFSFRELNSNSYGTTLFLTSTYLMQSPAVLFTAIFCSLYTIDYFLRNQYLHTLYYFIISYIVVCVLYFTVLRAPIALWLLSIGFYIFFKKPRKRDILYILVGLILTVSSFEIIKLSEINEKYSNIVSTITGNSISPMTNNFVIKQERFGSNGKFEELMLAKDLIVNNNDLIKIIFGKGFGGKWYSPAAGGEVGFTHSLFTYLILKMGLVGSIAFFIYILLIMRSLFSILFKNRHYNSQNLIFTFSVLSVFVVNIGLEPGFKTLDFGVISLLYFSHSLLEDKNQHQGRCNG